MDPYMMRGEGARIWHIPQGPGGSERPLCGAVIGDKRERRYLPSPIPRGDENCPRCMALQQLPTAARERALAKLAEVPKAAGELRSVATNRAADGLHVVLTFNGMVLDVFTPDEDAQQGGH